VLLTPDPIRWQRSLIFFFLSLLKDTINLGGTIPYELQNLTILETIALQRGFIKGTIPSTLGNLKSLKDLDLNFNNITGTIPENLYNAKTLEQLDLNDNELSGTVSPKIGDLKNLFYLQLGNDAPWGKNTFEGTIPPGVSGLNDLRKYFVSQNAVYLLVYLLNRLHSALSQTHKKEVIALNDLNMEGTLPTLTDNTKLQFLDVSENEFTGPIDSTNWGNKPDLEYVDFSNNKFSGSIPSGFGNAKDLVLASFDTNDFTGSMPAQICDLRSGSLKNLTSDCAGATPQVTCAFPTCCTGCFN
jgi:Leucine-rich repeat (LRR) protein